MTSVGCTSTQSTQPLQITVTMPSILVKVDALNDSTQQSIELPQQTLATESQDAKLDALSQQVKHVFDLQKQSLKAQTDLLLSIKNQAVHNHEDACPPPGDHAPKYDPNAMTPIRFYEGNSLWLRQNRWFNWYLDTVFRACPGSFDTDDKKKEFTLLHLLPQALDGYRLHIKRGGLTDSWAALSAYLSVE